MSPGLPPQAQQISLNYHCKCEQWVHFASGGFFNFNGTAGGHSGSTCACASPRLKFLHPVLPMHPALSPVHQLYDCILVKSNRYYRLGDAADDQKAAVCIALKGARSPLCLSRRVAEEGN